jgi:N-formylglutamate amidohydrolase
MPVRPRRMAPAPAFDRLGPAVPESPVVVSVPHAGRDYPPALASLLAAPAATLVALEDRHVDAVALAARGGATVFVQRVARAWIDLNRGEDERDPRVDAAAKGGEPASARLRSGLGLVPRRAGGVANLWRRRLEPDEVEARLRHAHRPYHQALAAALEAARARFGTAVLVDLHSMPPLGAGRPRVVLGDRFGRTAGTRFVARAEAVAQAAGLPVAVNAPYAGGHVVDRHGRPRAGVHALQVELDRTLYLDARLERPGPGLARTAALVRRLMEALADEAVGGADGGTTLLAAE